MCGVADENAGSRVSGTQAFGSYALTDDVRLAAWQHMQHLGCNFASSVHLDKFLLARQ